MSQLLLFNFKNMLSPCCSCRTKRLPLLTSRLIVPRTFRNSINLSRNNNAGAFKSTSPPSVTEKDLENYSPIYKFPLIIVVRAICRLKLYQTAFTVTTVPIFATLHSLDYAPQSSVVYTVAVGTLACAMLYVTSELTRRSIGAIYVDKQNSQKIRVAHLTFWGYRRDIEVDVQDVIPLADISQDPRDIFVKFARYSTKDVLFFSIRYGRILDKYTFESIFGSLKL